MRISDWSSDVCSSDLLEHGGLVLLQRQPGRCLLERGTGLALVGGGGFQLLVRGVVRGGELAVALQVVVGAGEIGAGAFDAGVGFTDGGLLDRKSTRLNSSH